ncbi:MAG TPA: hypothetical protein VEX13_12680 [Chloroflexia bacterium]|nr:hypothetical protein [Chloroflexia bacterium]
MPIGKADNTKARYLAVCWLVGLTLIVAGCSVVDSPAPIHTPTPPNLSIPDVAGQPTMQSPGEGGSETATAVSPVSWPTPAPTLSGPDATMVAATAQAGYSEQATAQAELANVPMPIETNEATVEPAPIDIATAWGTEPGMQQVSLPNDKDSIFVLHSVDPDGKFVTGALVSRVLGPEPGVLMMVDVKDGHTTEIARYRGPGGADVSSDPSPREPLFGSDTDGEWVVWNEQTAIKAYNVRTGAIHTLLDKPAEPDKLPPTPPDMAGAPAVTDVPGPPSFHAPRIDRGIVVWQEFTYLESGGFVTPARIMQANLATGDVVEVSSYGGVPVVSWPYVGWIEYPRTGEGVNKLTVYHKGFINLLNLETGARTVLETIKDVLVFGLAADAVVYSQTWGQAFITDMQGTSSRLISATRTYPFRYVSMNERVVTWIGNPNVVYDRAQDRRVYLGLPGLAQAAMRVVKGHTLAFQLGATFIVLEGAKPGDILPNDQYVYVVDTDKLPK